MSRLTGLSHLKTLRTASLPLLKTIADLAIPIGEAIERTTDGCQGLKSLWSVLYELVICVVQEVEDYGQGNHHFAPPILSDACDMIRRIHSAFVFNGSSGHPLIKASAITNMRKDLEIMIGVFLTQAHTWRQQQLHLQEVRLRERLENLENLEATVSCDLEKARRLTEPTAVLPPPSRARMHRLPAPPHIFFGRETETDMLVSQCCGCDGANIAILGTGGVGKTSLALAVLHHPKISAEFGTHRYFVACDSATDTDELVSVIADHLNIPYSKNTRSEMVSRLSRQKTLLILDNFESPWEPAASRLQVEETLTRLTTITNLSLIITLRGAERPLGTVWTQPTLRPITPYGRADSLQTFTAITGMAESDDAVDSLLSKLDELPLAVTLVAHLALFEPPSSLVRRWEVEQTAMVTRRTETRLGSLDTSIKMSLNSQRLNQFPHSTTLLSLLSLLPDGLSEKEFIPATTALGIPARALSVLLQTSLALIRNSRICVLAPIRAFMQRNHPLPAELVLSLCDHYLGSFEQVYKFNHNSDLVVSGIKRLREEIGNIESVFRWGLTCTGAATINLIQRIIDLFWFEDSVAFSRTALLDDLLSASRQQADGSLTVRCLLLIGRPRLNGSLDLEASRAFFKEAMCLSQEIQYQHGEAEALCQLGWLTLHESTRTSRALIDSSLTIFRLLNDPFGQARCYRILAYCDLSSGTSLDVSRRCTQALLCLRDGPASAMSLESREQHWGNSVGHRRARLEALVLSSRSVHNFNRGLLDNAKADAIASRDLENVLTTRVESIQVDIILGAIALTQSDIMSAIDRFNAVLTRFKGFADWDTSNANAHVSAVMDILFSLTRCYLALYDVVSARSLCSEAQSFWDRHALQLPAGFNRGPHPSLFLGLLFYSEGNYGSAATQYKLAWEDTWKGKASRYHLAPQVLAAEYGLFGCALHKSWKHRCNVEVDEDHPSIDQAINSYVIALAIARNFDPITVPSLLDDLADIFYDVDDHETSKALTVAALRTLRIMGAKRSIAHCLVRLADIEGQTQNPDNVWVRKLYEQALELYKKGLDRKRTEEVVEKLTFLERN